MSASRARKAFDKTAKDINQLLEIHKKIGGSEVGRRRLEVLNKSALVLLTAVWEAYCEDIAAEALEHLIARSPSASSLPNDLKRKVAKELRADPNELVVWTLSGDGWKVVLRNRLAELQKQRNWNFNTPKSTQVDNLLRDAIGLVKVSDAWHWQGMSVESSRKKLDRLVALRGDIAHRGNTSISCQKPAVKGYFEHVKRLVGKTGGRVATFVTKATGKRPW